MPHRPIPARLSRRRRAILGHMCPMCRRPWALTADRDVPGFVVICRYCSYQREVAIPGQAGPRDREALAD